MKTNPAKQTLKQVFRLLGLLLAWPAAVQAQYTFVTNNDGSLTISNYSGTEPNLVIPSTTNGLPVTGIGASAFANVQTLYSVIIPDSVTSIGDSAFYQCYALTNVVTGNGVTNIGADAFYFADSLASLAIGNQVTSIGYGAFEYCVRLSTVSIPSNVVAIADYAFDNAGISDLSIAHGVTSIGSHAFADCYSLLVVTVPNSVTNIGPYAFSINTSGAVAAYFELPAAPFDSTWFYGASNLSNIYDYTATNGSVSIAGYAGTGGAAVIPSAIGGQPVTSIGPGVLQQASALTSITIPNGVTNLGGYAFAGCTNLTAVNVQDGAASFDSTVFAGDNIVNIFDYTTNYGSANITGYYCSSVPVTIPPFISGLPVVSIGAGAFANCAALSTVSVPAGVTNIGDYAFANCTNLTQILFASNAPAIGAAIFQGDSNGMVYFSFQASGWGTSLGGLPTISNPFLYTLDNGSITITKYLGAGGNVVIPGTILGYPVTGIASNAVFLTGGTITIPGSVTNLANFAITALPTVFGGHILQGIYFQGNAPSGTNAFSFLFGALYGAPVYYLPGTTGWGTNFDGLTAQVWFPGELQVNLNPPGAVTDGARWQVDGAAWQTNGAVVTGLAEGNHTVSFGPAKGWVPPPDLTLFVGDDYLIATNSAPYFALPGGPSQVTFQVLHSFSGQDGATPECALTISSNHVLYGTTSGGGCSNVGTLYSINPDGSGFTNLLSFTGFQIYAGSSSSLLISSNLLYGAAAGSVFKFNLDTLDFTTVCSNLDDDSGVVLSGNTLYGTTATGGSGGYGTVFSVNTDGSDFTTLQNFPGTNFYQDQLYGGLVLCSNVLYGSTFEGTDAGTLFSINTDGSGFKIWPTPKSYYTTSMILSGNTLYGSVGAVVFSVKTDGTGFAFIGGITAAFFPGCPLLLSGNTLYGVIQGGGETGFYGGLYAISTQGAGVTNFYSFTNDATTNSTGDQPESGLLLVGTTLYGTTSYGGTNAQGTIYMLTFPPPQLQITPSGTNFVFSWPNGTVGAGYDAFSVQSTTNLSPPATWCAVPVPPVQVNGLNTVINPMPEVPTFYRLSQ